MKRYDVYAFQDRTWWMLEVPDLGAMGQAASRATVQADARDLISVWLDAPEAHVPPPRIRWVAPRHFD